MTMIARMAMALSLCGGGAFAAPSLDGDASRGREVYESRCSACHSIDANRVGPAHRGVYGRRAGSARGYAYSAALLGSKVVWTERSLDAWLVNPQALIPGARMGYRLSDPQERADVIAYLKANPLNK